MEFVVLGLLHLGVKTIYEMNAAFKQGISLFYSASYGSLQAAVKKLLDADYVVVSDSVENGRQKKNYVLTPLGRLHFLEWMSEDFIQGNKLEVTILSKLHFLGLIESPEERELLINKMILAVDEACDVLKKTDEDLQTLPPDVKAHPVFHYQYQSLQYGRHAHEHALEWFKGLLLEEKKRNSKQTNL